MSGDTVGMQQLYPILPLYTVYTHICAIFAAREICDLNLNELVKL